MVNNFCTIELFLGSPRILSLESRLIFPTIESNFRIFANLWIFLTLGDFMLALSVVSHTWLGPQFQVYLKLYKRRDLLDFRFSRHVVTRQKTLLLRGVLIRRRLAHSVRSDVFSVGYFRIQGPVIKISSTSEVCSTSVPALLSVILIFKQKG